MKFLFIASLFLGSASSFAGEVQIAVPAGAKITSSFVYYGGDGATSFCSGNFSVKKGNIRHNETGDTATNQLKSRVMSGLCSRWINSLRMGLEIKGKSYDLLIEAQPSELYGGGGPTTIKDGVLDCVLNQNNTGTCGFSGIASLTLWSAEKSKLEVKKINLIAHQ